MKPARARDAAIVAGILSAVITWWVWGALSPLPLVADEQSYVLQARIFATGHWTAPAPPIPEFFEQSVVLVSPAVASKFPPGHALLLSIGALFGAPMLMPLVLTAVSGALFFLLASRVANMWVAGFAVVIWLVDPVNLRFRPGYYSEVTTLTLWLASWWALLEWRRAHDRRWLLALAAAIGWGAFTRPLTMFAFAIPVGVVVIRDVVRLKAWRDFALATALGMAMLGVIPLWSARTTGDWRLSPLALYTKNFLPFDKPGFGVDQTPPARPLNPMNRYTYNQFYPEHAQHTLANLPWIAAQRLRRIGTAEWGGVRLMLVPFAVAGLFAMSGEVVFALVCSAALFAAYLSYGHDAGWTLYYLEGLPVLAMLAALGMWRVIEWTAVRARGTEPSRIRKRMCIAATVGLVVLVAYEVPVWRRHHIVLAQWPRDFEETTSKPEQPPAVIFVHYKPGDVPHQFVVRNSPHLENDPVWVVNDLGERNRELMRFAGSRVPVAFYEEGSRFEVDTTLVHRR